MIAAASFVLVGIAATAVGAAAIGVALLVAGVAAAGASFWFLRPNVAGEAATIVPSTQGAGVLTNWRTRQEELKEGVGNGERSLAKALRRHAVELSVGESADAAFERYKTECGAREEQDRQARERDRLKLTLEQRNRAEEQNALREEAIIALRDAGTSAGLSETNPAEIAAKLRTWQDQRQMGLDAQDDAQREWAELQQLMSGRTPAELRDEADKSRAVADEASDGFSAAEVESVGAKSAESELPRLRRDHQAAAELAAGRAQLADSQAGMLKSVAEAEAELEEAEEEFARVAELGEILEKTTKYLEEAQRRVYETIAPTLARTLKEWLPRVAVCADGGTPGPRYNDAHVDPQTLAVRVRLGDGPWRDAAVLSAGTKEQIFLLLRVALTEHLVKDGEVVPLLLDEVTAQCDSTRRKALLELLLELSTERQIILFTHETAVFEWGKANLPAAAVRTLQPIS